jgi:penicillin-binding protein 1B
VELEEMPPELPQAVLAVEDRRFHRHFGVDPVRVAGAALANLRAGRMAQGGSTITQQLVKNYYLSPEKSLERKVREAAMALLLEWEHDKEAILQAYLNAVYLGQAGAAGVVGVGQAARRYFGRDVSELDLAECALLAGMIRAPNRFAPHRHPGAARDRRNLVLRLMEEQGRITPGERRRAARAPLPTTAGEAPDVLNRAPWFVDYVQRELGERYSREELRSEGLRIHTTLDPRAQAAAERAVREGLAALEARHPHLRGDAGEDAGEGAPDGEAGSAGSAGEDARPLQAALVAMDPRTGDVLAMVGGRSFRETQFNRAVQARRQPGSLFKPFVYLAALSDTAGRPWTLASRVSDSAFTVTAGGRPWSPANYDGETHGRPSLRVALEESYNVATARLAREVGLDRVVETARRLGLSSRLEPVPSLALGAFEVTPLEMTGAYAALAGSGIRPQPLSVTAVTRPDGSRLEARELAMERVAPSGPVHLVNRALQGVLEDGTGARARELGYRGPAAGKTGTTSGYRDAWFVGYTPDLVALVWVGYDDNRPLDLSGAEAALPLWVRFAGRYSGRGDATFRTPPGVVTAKVAAAGAGGSGEEDCREEYFLEGTVPERTCGDGWWIF